MENISIYLHVNCSLFHGTFESSAQYGELMWTSPPLMLRSVFDLREVVYFWIHISGSSLVICSSITHFVSCNTICIQKLIFSSPNATDNQGYQHLYKGAVEFSVCHKKYNDLQYPTQAQSSARDSDF